MRVKKISLLSWRSGKHAQAEQPEKRSPDHAEDGETSGKDSAQCLCHVSQPDSSEPEKQGEDKGQAGSGLLVQRLVFEHERLRIEEKLIEEICSRNSTNSTIYSCRFEKQDVQKRKTWKSTFTTSCTATAARAFTPDDMVDKVPENNP